MPSDREKRAEQQRRRRQARAGLATDNDSPPDAPEAPPVPLPLRTPADALVALEEQLNLARADGRASPQVRARTVGYLVMTAVKVIEAASLADRLEEIERVLHLREQRSEQPSRSRVRTPDAR